jgi:predicted DNA binding CopG/RHH family protein
VTTTTRKSRIPEFKTYKEEAEFWDTHDFTDFMDELRPVEVVYKPAHTEAITIRFTNKDIEDVRREAKDVGIGVGTLIRMWVKEKLSQKRRLAV